MGAELTKALPPKENLETDAYAHSVDFTRIQPLDTEPKTEYPKILESDHAAPDFNPVPRKSHVIKSLPSVTSNTPYRPSILHSHDSSEGANIVEID